MSSSDNGLSIGFVLLLALTLLGLTLYGGYLAFSVSVILGILVILIEPLPLILGVLGVLGHPEVAKKVADWIGL